MYVVPFLSFPCLASTRKANTLERQQIIPPPSRQAISRVCALIQTFARYSIPLTETLLMSAYEWCRHNGLEETGVVLSRALEKQLLEEIVGIVDTDE